MAALFCPHCHRLLHPNKGWAAQVYDGYCNHCDVVISNGADIYDLLGDEDYFFEGEDHVLMEYLNPNATAGLQFVQLFLRPDVIREAQEKTQHFAEFFIYLEDHASQVLIDEGTPEFEEECKTWDGAKVSYTGRNAGTYERLIAFSNKNK